MLSPADRAAVDWLHKLGVTASPDTIHAVVLARNFFAQQMRPPVNDHTQLSFLKGMDLHSDVDELTLTPGQQVVAFRYLSENPVRLFYTLSGASPSGLGVNPANRVFKRFRVVKPVRALRSRCTSVKLVWTDDPTFVALGGGTQLIIPNAPHALSLVKTNEIARAVGGLNLSPQGQTFLFRHEALADVSNRLHWPGGSSGVTLGPGYDMKSRSKIEIAQDMVSIGVAKPIADAIGEASKLSLQKAKTFVTDNADLVVLSAEQETRLLNLIVPQYESVIKKHITVNLRQSEYDALVSFVYNPGGSFIPIAKAINEGRVDDAMATIKLRNITGGVASAGLSNRRADEVTLYRFGSYGF